jgi:HNH endonuclease
LPGCQQARFLHAHHIEHWAHGGPTELANLIQLCRHHHRLLHEGGYTLEHTTSGTLRFKRPDGRAIPPVSSRANGDPARLCRANHVHGTAPRPDTPTGRGSGDRLDLALQIDGLVWADPRFPDD